MLSEVVIYALSILIAQRVTLYKELLSLHIAQSQICLTYKRVIFAIKDHFISFYSVATWTYITLTPSYPAANI